MNRHHQRFVLRQYIEHKNGENRRLHIWTNGIAWLALATVLSQVPLPIAVRVPLLGSNLGAAWTVLSVLYWLPADLLTPVLVFAATAWPKASLSAIAQSRGISARPLSRKSVPSHSRIFRPARSTLNSSSLPPSNSNRWSASRPRLPSTTSS